MFLQSAAAVIRPPSPLLDGSYFEFPYNSLFFLSKSWVWSNATGLVFSFWLMTPAIFFFFCQSIYKSSVSPYRPPFPEPSGSRFLRVKRFTSGPAKTLLCQLLSFLVELEWWSPPSSAFWAAISVPITSDLAKVLESLGLWSLPASADFYTSSLSPIVLKISDPWYDCLVAPGCTGLASNWRARV